MTYKTISIWKSFAALIFDSPLCGFAVGVAHRNITCKKIEMTAIKTVACWNTKCDCIAFTYSKLKPFQKPQYMALDFHSLLLCFFCGKLVLKSTKENINRYFFLVMWRIQYRIFRKECPLFEKSICRCSATLLLLFYFILQRFWCSAPYLKRFKWITSRIENRRSQIPRV